MLRIDHNHRGRWTLAIITALLAFVIAAPLALAAPPAPTPVSQPAKPDSPNSPNSYTLCGDCGNQGHLSTSFSTDGSGYGWYFEDTNSTAQFGLKAYSPSKGVWGHGGTYGVYADGTSYGVYSYSSGGTGVYGYGSNYGLYGSGSGYGVYGSGGSYGLYGYGGNYGVYGSSGNYGLYGYGGNSGVVGQSYNSTGVAYGVRGLIKSSNNASAGGYFTATAGIGVYGGSSTRFGVYGISPASYGVYGISTSSFGVAGTSNRSIGVSATSVLSYGLYASTTSGTTALRAHNPNKTSGHYAGYFDGNVFISGSYVATGTKSAEVYTDQGPRLMYADESTQNYFSDQGTAALKNGDTVIKIDALYAQTVSLDQPYMVIVVPNSADTAGLAVINKTATSFEVRELNGGKGSFQFDWRITALRKGYEKERMAVAPPALAPLDISADPQP